MLWRWKDIKACFKLAAYSTYRPSLLSAAEQGDAATIEFRLNAGDSIDVTTDEMNYTLLHLAAMRGHKNVAELLVAKGIDLNKQDINGQTPLLWALKRGRTDVARFLIEKGADVKIADKHGWTALHEAAGNGTAEITGLLVAAGADVNAQESYFAATPLYIAASVAGQEGVVQVLLEKGARPDLPRKDGDTAAALLAPAKKPAAPEL